MSYREDNDAFAKIVVVVVAIAVALLVYMHYQEPPCLEWQVIRDGSLECRGNEFYKKCEPPKVCVKRAEAK